MRIRVPRASALSPLDLEAEAVSQEEHYSGRIRGSIDKRTLVSLLLPLALAGCGGGAEEEYKEGFPSINERLVALGQDLGGSVANAGGSTNQELGDRFDDYAQELGDLQQLDELEPPDDLAEGQDRLVSAMGEAQGALEELANAAEQGDADAARRATAQLVASSRELRDARRTLEGAVQDL